MSENQLEILKAGSYYRLNHPVGPIPAGTYRLEEFDDTCWQFSVGRRREIRFFIMFGSRALLSAVNRTIGRRDRTRAAVFARCYYEVLCNPHSSTAIPSANTPISACLMPEKYEQRYRLPSDNIALHVQ